MKLEYLIFDLLIFLAPTLSVYFYRSAKWPELKLALQSIVFVAIPYLVWDTLVTGKWWQFNSNYILGIKMFGLPIEEWLFFLVVPWAMLVLWHNKNLVIESKKVNWGKWLFWGIGLLGIGVATQSWYGLLVVGLYLLLVIILNTRVHLLDWVVLAVTTILATLIFNTYLTSRPVVTYYPTAISGWKIGTVPIEDFYYGLVLVLGVMYVYEQLIANRQKNS